MIEAIAARSVLAAALGETLTTMPAAAEVAGAERESHARGSRDASHNSLGLLASR